MPYMYILECADGSYYTGSTWDLERRLWEHQNGGSTPLTDRSRSLSGVEGNNAEMIDGQLFAGARYTSKRLPVKLVYCEEYDRIDDAFYREKQVQGWSRKKKEALMASDTNQLHLLAMCRNETASTPLSDRSHSRSLSRGVSGAEPGVEGNNAGPDKIPRSLSGVETSIKGTVE